MKKLLCATSISLPFIILPSIVSSDEPKQMDPCKDKDVACESAKAEKLET